MTVISSSVFTSTDHRFPGCSRIQSCRLLGTTNRRAIDRRSFGKLLALVSHPSLWTYSSYPISKARYEPKVFLHVLLADPPDRDNPARRQCDRGTKDDLRHENSFRMMTKCPMAKVGGNLLGLVEPAVDGQIIIDGTAPSSYAGEGMMVRMGHEIFPLEYVVVFLDCDVPLIEVEFDDPLVHVEPEFAESAI